MRHYLLITFAFYALLSASPSQGAENLTSTLNSPKTVSVLLGRFDLRGVEQAHSAFSCHAASPAFSSAIKVTKGGLAINSLKARRLGRSKQFTFRKRLGTQNHRYIIHVTKTRSGSTARLQERVWSNNQFACRFNYRGPFASL
jgi:hypothetical protein